MAYIQPPGEFAAFPDLVRVTSKTRVKGGGKLRRRWRDGRGHIYEWDSQHGRLEKYNSHGKHLGEYDSQTGGQTKPADASRSVEP